MKKIMFNDQYGLTQAVLEGRKTMTRRLVGKRMTEWDIRSYLKGYTELANNCAQYKIGEVVAVAQSYHDAGFPDIEDNFVYHRWCDEPGWTNKMFVKSELMPHQIRITEIKVERMQDISDEDCLKEGVFLDVTAPECYQPFYTFVNSKTKDNTPIGFENPKYAFQVLIDKVSGKGTWQRNPWVFVYSFELIK